MLFDSSVFLVFFGLFLVAYYAVRGSLALRNGLILLASCIFYGYWDVRFLLLLLFTATVDFCAGLVIADGVSDRVRKAGVALSLASNLAVLGFFKYWNFFAETLRDLAAALHLQMDAITLKVVLPVGISFYTFQSISYVLDVYWKRVPACRNPIQFLAFISFFPQLVAGPIERAGHLLPQFQRTLVIGRLEIESGLWLILTGYCKKIVVADSLAPFVSLAFDHPAPGAPLLAAGALAFAFQIYCDFSGYSDIARGTARLLGFELMQNFNLPYFSKNPREFWQRWHISLSTWFRDYLYVPLGGNRQGQGRTCVNLLIVMIVAGLWHGANVTFLLWGLCHGIALIVHRLWSQRKSPQVKLPGWLSWSITFGWILFTWVLFRADSIDAVYRYASAAVDLHAPFWLGYYLLNIGVLIVPLVVLQLGSTRADPVGHANRTVAARPFAQAALILLILAFCYQAKPAPFIYFQF